MKKVGSISTAIGLLGLGVLLLVEQVYPTQTWAANPLRWWPLLLIGLGIELLYWRAIKQETEMKIDPLILIFLLAIFCAGLYSQARVHLMDSGILGWKYNSTKSYEVRDVTSGIQPLEVRNGGRLESYHLVASSGAGEVVVPLYLEKPEYRKAAVAGQTLEATVGRGVKTIDLFARQRSVTMR